MSARSMFLSLAFSLLVLGQTVAAEPPPRTDRYGDPLPPGAIARLGSVRWRHPAPVGPLAFSPDNKTLAVLTGDVKKSTLWLWDIATGALRRRFDMPPLWGGIAFTPDGRSLVVHGIEGVQLVDPTNGKVVRQFRGPEHGVSCFALSPDGKTLAVGCRATFLDKPNLIYLWDTATGAERGRLDGHRTAIETLAFSADGRRLFSASDDYDATRAGSKTPRIIRGTICVWDVSARKLRRQINGKGRLTVFAPDGKTLAVVRDKKIHVWDIDADRDLWQLPGDMAFYFFLPDGQTLVGGGQDQPLALWDAATGRQVRRFQGYCPPNTWIRGLSPDGKLMATATDWTNGDTAVRLWDVATGKEVRPFGGHVDTISGLAFAPDGKTLVSGSQDQTLRVWDPRSGRELRRYSGHQKAITAVAFFPDGKVVASGDADHRIHLWDPATGKQLRCLDARPPREEVVKFGWGPVGRGGIEFLAFTPDGRTLIAARGAAHFDDGVGVAFHGTVTFWDPGTGRRWRVVELERSVPLAVSPDGTVLACHGISCPTQFLFEQKLIWRSLVLGKEIARTDLRRDQVLEQVVFSADGKTLLVCSRFDRSKDNFPDTRLFEIATRKEALGLKREGGAGTFSPDGSIVALAGRKDGRLIRLLDVDGGMYLGQRSGSLGRLRCCTFSPDGTLLAAGGDDPAILVWAVKSPPLNRRPPVKEATAADLERWWADLAGADAARAHQAIGQFARRPGQSVPLLCQRLRPIPGVPGATIARHIKDLDSEDFRTREQAAAALEKLGELAEPALRKALTAAPALEVRRRVEQLLAQADAAVLSPEQLRAVRATTILERAGTPEARQLLHKLAEGAPGSRLTEEARASLRRLSKRSGGPGD